MDYLGPDGLAPYDLVLSYTGGGALDALRTQLGARQVVPIYGSVDPALHQPVPPRAGRRALLSYLGTYAADRQAALEALFVEPARRLPASASSSAARSTRSASRGRRTSGSSATCRPASTRRSTARPA